MVLKIPRQMPGAAPENNYQLFEVKRLTGINLTKEHSEMEDSESMIFQNYFQEQKGVWKQRNGYIKFNAAAISGTATRVMAVREYNPSPASGITRRVIAIVKDGTGDKIFSADYATKTFAEVTGATALTHSEEWSIVQWLDTLYISNGIDAVQVSTNGTTRADLTVAVGGTARKGRYMTIWQDRLVIAGDTADPSAVYFSDTLVPTRFQANRTIYVGKNDGDTITAIATTGVNTNLGSPTGQLMIFKYGSTWVCFGNVERDLTLNNLSNTIGCAGQRAICHTPVGLIWVGRDGVYTASNDGYPTKIDEKIRALFSGENTNFFDSMNLTTLYNRIAVGYSNKLAQFKISYAGSFDANIAKQVWADLRDTQTDGLQWCGPHKGQSISCFWEDSQGNSLGGSDTSPYVYILDSGATDDGAAVVTKWVSKNYDVGLSGIEKLWRKYKFKFDVYGDTYLNITFNANYKAQYTAAGFIGLSGALWDTAKWDVDKWSASNILGYLSGNLPVVIGTNMFIIMDGTANTTNQHELLGFLLQHQTKRKFIWR